MKCNNCGAPLQLDQKFCPNCGSPNEQGLKHANDMENYNKKFNRTRSKVGAEYERCQLTLTLAIRN